MKLKLDTISTPATGTVARRIIRAVDSGKSIPANPQGKAFIASLLEELRAPVRRTVRTKR